MAMEAVSFRFDNETLFKLSELTKFYKSNDKRISKTKVMADIISTAYDNINTSQKKCYNNENEIVYREIVELEYTIIKLLTTNLKDVDNIEEIKRIINAKSRFQIYVEDKLNEKNSDIDNKINYLINDKKNEQSKYNDDTNVTKTDIITDAVELLFSYRTRDAFRLLNKEQETYLKGVLKQYQSLNNEFFNNLIFEILILKQLIVSTNGITESQLDETVKKVLDNITNANSN